MSNVWLTTENKMKPRKKSKTKKFRPLEGSSRTPFAILQINSTPPISDPLQLRQTKLHHFYKGVFRKRNDREKCSTSTGNSSINFFGKSLDDVDRKYKHVESINPEPIFNKLDTTNTATEKEGINNWTDDGKENMWSQRNVLLRSNNLSFNSDADSNIIEEDSNELLDLENSESHDGTELIRPPSPLTFTQPYTNFDPEDCNSLLELPDSVSQCSGSSFIYYPNSLVFTE